MYSKQEASLMRKKFWTSFGQYMRPVTGSMGETVNWVNYKTGVKHIYFRMDVDTTSAAIGIELHHPSTDLRREQFEKFLSLRSILVDSVGEAWNWELDAKDEIGVSIGRISKRLTGVNIFQENDWPSIISFLKPRIIALDECWSLVKAHFEPM